MRQQSGALRGRRCVGLTRLRNVTSTTGETRGQLRATNHLRDMAAQELKGSEASPSAHALSERVKSTGSGDPCGFDARKRIKGRKRHIVTDTPGFEVGAEVRPASVQYHDEAPLGLRSRRSLTDLQGGP